MGTAQVTLVFGSWTEGRVASSSGTVTIVAPKQEIKLVNVSSRLVGELIHPNRQSILEGLLFSPDGKRLIAGDYPGGVIVLWDVATGKAATTLETGYGSRSSAEYFFLSPDWRILYVPSRGHRKYERVEQDGKTMLRWEFDGDVRAWDLASGQLQRIYKHNPQRNILHMQLSPDGSKFATLDELPGVDAGPPKRAVSLWNSATGDCHSLSDTVRWFSQFSPNGRLLAVNGEGRDGAMSTAKLVDTSDFKEKLSIGAVGDTTPAYVRAFSPNGEVMAGIVKNSVKLWETTTGKEVASFAADSNETLTSLSFSPDGRTLAVTNWGAQEGKLRLFNVIDRRPIKTITLGEKTPGSRFILRPPVFSLDGKWVAQITQVFPDVGGGTIVDVHDVPQPRIHMIEASTGEIREVLIAPQGFAASACFSPDGKTLATGGHGRVLLWDLSKPPGSSLGTPTKGP